VAVQTGEGKLDIIYHTTSVPAGPRTHGGYLSRPTYQGQFPTVLILGPNPTPTSTVKDFCRILARHGIAALAPDLTDSHDTNLRINNAVASFLKDPTGEWSNAQLGYGVLAFGAGIFDFARLGASDGDVVAGVTVGGTVDDPAADLMASAGVRSLSILSRGDETSDVDESLSHSDDLPATTFVVYPSGDHGFWDASSEGYDDDRYTDVVERLVGFFTDSLPERI